MAKNIKKTIILLGGNSSKNAVWIEQIAAEYSNDCDVIPVVYENWKTHSDIHFQTELEKLAKLTENLSDYIVVAKSAGVLLALIAIEKGIILPSFLLALGTPVEYARHRRLDIAHLYEAALPVKRILSIQQTHDPQGSADIIRNLLPTRVESITIPGNDHQYSDWELIKRYTFDTMR